MFVRCQRMPLVALGSAAVFLTAVSSGRGEVRMSAIFGSGMVVQREKPVPVWGWAEPGEKVTASLAGQTAEARAGEDGRWLVTLPPLPPQKGNAGQEMVVQGGNRIAFDDVLVGDVWLCAGEEEIARPLGASAAGAGEDLQRPKAPMRLFTVAPKTAAEPETDVSGRWVKAEPSRLAEFSALAHHFGKEIGGSLEVPVGLILAAHADAPIEAWMSRESLSKEPAAKPILEFYEGGGWERFAQEAGQERFQAWKQIAERRPGAAPPEPKPFELTDVAQHRPASVFNPMVAPLAPFALRGVLWDHGKSNVSRATQYADLLPALIRDWRVHWKREDLPFVVVQLRARRFDRADEFLPGRFKKQVVDLGAQGLDDRAGAELREAQAKMLEGWRPTPFGGRGKARVEDAAVYMEMGNDMTGVTWDGPIARMNYEINLEAKRVDGGDFFCGLTFPVGPDAATLILGGWGGQIVGVSCLDYFDAANNETTRFMEFEMGQWYDVRLRVLPDKIQAWIDDKPIVDVTTTGRKISVRSECDLSVPLGVATWRTTGAFRNARVREVAPDGASAGLDSKPLKAFALANVEMAVTVDLGPEPDETTVAQRLTRAAMAAAYGQKDLYRPGPAFESAAVEGNKVRVRFRNAGNELVAKGGKVRGFAVASSVSRWVWAEAEIDKNIVVVHAPGVKDPKGVRYAWQDLPERGANLYGENDLAVAAFRTDDFAPFTKPYAKPGDLASYHPRWSPPVEDASLPRVLVMGDSISGGPTGYATPLREKLRGKANVIVESAMRGDTWQSAQNIGYRTDLALADDALKRYLASYGPFDVILFNMGIHEYMR
ncbi:MAG TPA: DUF1080 domain-containing protein, partial [Sumerlaeia bacterium]|nr:DUF1080 domain-containing protein [Sumerlaeia bacterium]